DLQIVFTKITVDIFKKPRSFNFRDHTDWIFYRPENDFIFVSRDPMVYFYSVTNDRAIAEGFITLLRSALKIDPTRIRCTSVEGFRLPAGSSFNEQLRSEVFESTVLVALLSPASLASIYTLFELGARWGAQKYLAPILIRGTNANDLRQPLSSLNAISSASETDISQLLATFAQLLKVEAFPHHSYAVQLRSFCEIGNTSAA
ncbi:MAG: toll/interleukin-1 receptor domain-containing protein, partial [Proteobacteria bacterium]